MNKVLLLDRLLELSTDIENHNSIAYCIQNEDDPETKNGLFKGIAERDLFLALKIYNGCFDDSLDGRILHSVFEDHLANTELIFPSEKTGAVGKLFLEAISLKRFEDAFNILESITCEAYDIRPQEEKRRSLSSYRTRVLLRFIRRNKNTQRYWLENLIIFDCKMYEFRHLNDLAALYDRSYEIESSSIFDMFFEQKIVLSERPRPKFIVGRDMYSLYLLGCFRTKENCDLLMSVTAPFAEHHLFELALSILISEGFEKELSKKPYGFYDLVTNSTIHFLSRYAREKFNHSLPTDCVCGFGALERKINECIELTREKAPIFLERYFSVLQRKGIDRISCECAKTYDEFIELCGLSKEMLYDSHECFGDFKRTVRIAYELLKLDYNANTVVEGFLSYYEHHASFERQFVYFSIFLDDVLFFINHSAKMLEQNAKIIDQMNSSFGDKYGADLRKQLIALSSDIKDNSTRFVSLIWNLRAERTIRRAIAEIKEIDDSDPIISMYSDLADYFKNVSSSLSVSKEIIYRFAD